MLHTLIAVMQDRPGVLNRAVSLFRRRGFNIESLAVASTETPGLSRMTVVVNRDDVTQVVSQLQRLVDIVSVHDVTFDRAVTQEMCLVRLGPAGHRLAEILGLAREFDARVVDASPQAMVLAIMDAPATISAFLDRVQRFGIEEITRSGRIAMSMTTAARGARPSPNANTKEFGAIHPFQAQADGFADEEAA
ncbi:MAG TPA: acetolactate synthase small subunit [Gemmatimonadaceae bacterium]|nr:acetolactate synthase small subunit [Gemmatimonadaceae bacterium]